jgi:eukaryotic-like serine/threonine-protein kinase
MRLSLGERLGPYEIVAPLGTGGMGEVYRARDVRLGREVAIKLVSSQSADPGSGKRLQLEAQAISQLQHPHVCSLFDIGTYGDEIFLVMEFLDGETLNRRLLRGALPVRELLKMALDLAGALEYAHSRGFIHRDVKPGNVFVTASGPVKLMDFGLVKLAGDGLGLGEVTAGTLTSGAALTSSSMVLGTLPYMSPEQARGEEIDRRSDLFSFGAVLYEASTGRQPFPGPTSAVVFDGILNRPPLALLALRPDLPPAFCDIVQKLLDKERELRYQSASELRTDLKRLERELVQGSSGRASSPVAPRLHRSLPKWILPAVIIAALSGLGFWFFKSRTGVTTSDSQSMFDIRALTSTGHATVAGLSPDGRYVAYVNRENGKSELRLLQTSTGRDVVILPAMAEVMAAPHFSPDGDFIYFLRELNIKASLSAGVFRIATLGGPATPVATDAAWFGLALSPDGKQLAYASDVAKGNEGQQIVVIHGDGSSRRVLTTANDPFWFLEWSPQGDRIAGVTFTDPGMKLVTLSAADGSVRDVNSGGWESLGQPVWTRDGKTIFAPGVPLGGATKQIWAIDSLSGTRHPVTSGTTEYNQFTLSIAAAGDLLAGTTNFDSELWVTDPGGEQPNRIGAGTNEGSDSVAWVGDHIISSNVRALTVRDLRGGSPRQFSSYSTLQRQLARCGPTQAAFLANDEKHHSHIGRIDVSTGIAGPVSDGPDDAKPDCTSDGSVVVFRQCSPDSDRCYIVKKSFQSPQVTRLVPLNAADSGYPRVSPDGSTVLFQREPDPKEPYRWLGLVPSAGGEVRYLEMPIPTADAEAVRWSPNSRTLLFSWRQNGVGNIWSMSVAGGRAKQVTHFDRDYIFDFDVAPDGRLAISRGKRVQDIVLIKNPK